ncbi:MAG: hypothetical protein J6S21_00845 [Victivallales bacterium]|nr:hypothetical protein [Victivallales bacterium]
MNEKYLKEAKEKCEQLAAERGERFDVRLFITGVSKRAAQLGKGYRRLIPTKPDDHTPLLDIALQEVAAGVVVIEHGDVSAIERAESSAIEIASIED